LITFIERKTKLTENMKKKIITLQNEKKNLENSCENEMKKNKNLTRLFILSLILYSLFVTLFDLLVIYLSHHIISIA
jgi:hypothetical protein